MYDHQISRRLFAFCWLLLLAALPLSASATIRYVAAGNPEAAAPYTNWATAAASIQPAIDVSSNGDEVVVGDGVYETGSRNDSRIEIDRTITVRSANGPDVTTIRGGIGLRGVNILNKGILEGFTVSGGRFRPSAPGLSWGGGIRGAAECIVRKCVVTDNSATDGAGIGGWAGDPRGTIRAEDCLLQANKARINGGGAFLCHLVRCTLVGNEARNGAGALLSTLVNCRIADNTARAIGGGVTRCSLTNCAVVGNSATRGGGAEESTLTHCTVSGNSSGVAGGAYRCSVTNSIVFGNRAPMQPDYLHSDFAFSCTAPLPQGTGNIAVDPQLADSWHLRSTSPCIGAGAVGFATGADLDGDPWASPPSMGCDEFGLGTVTGALEVTVSAAFTNVAVGYTVPITASIVGHASDNTWSLGDGTVLSNQTWASHAWASPGLYPIVFSARNATFPGWVSATTWVSVAEQTVMYVSTNSLTPAAPFAGWDQAAHTIQDAVDAAQQAGALVWVGDGVYDVGSRVAGADGLTNRVVIDKPITVRSTGGSERATILGDAGLRCAYLANRAVLDGFTITNGLAGVFCSSLDETVRRCVIAGCGGGVEGGAVTDSTIKDNRGLGVDCAMISGCVISGNFGGGARSSALMRSVLTRNGSAQPVPIGLPQPVEFGGGASDCALNTCLVTQNAAKQLGGGVYYGSVDHCTITSNSAGWGGGGVQSTLTFNSIVYGNQAPRDPDMDLWSESLSKHVCARPWAGRDGVGVAKITNAPAFADAAAGDYRLASHSPCINRGEFVPGVTPDTDLDGSPRVVGGIADIGAYEFQGSLPWFDTDFDGLLDTWELAHFGNITNALPHADPDADTLDNSVEANLGTDPLLADTDGDGFEDGLENRRGSDPLLRASRPAVIVPADFDGDGSTDISVYRPASGAWFVRQSTNGQPFSGGPVFWKANAIPVTGDYDGDALADVAAFLLGEGRWYILESTSMQTSRVDFGWSGVIPVPEDYDGDLRTDVAIYAPLEGRWYIRRSHDDQTDTVDLGWKGVVPVAADYDGDGAADPAIYAPDEGRWYIRRSSDGSTARVEFGWKGVTPVAGDFDGDGLADQALYVPQEQRWFVHQSRDGATARIENWARPLAFPVAADYDGDRRVDASVYVPTTGKWYIRSSIDGQMLGGGTNATGGVQWGHPSVVPVLPACQILLQSGLNRMNTDRR